jgi:hypothetical protein
MYLCKDKDMLTVVLWHTLIMLSMNTVYSQLFVHRLSSLWLIHAPSKSVINPAECQLSSLESVYPFEHTLPCGLEVGYV